MLIPSATAPYAAIPGLGYVYLSARVGVMRWRLNCYFEERDARLRRLVRVRVNFAEYVPLALLLIAVAELLGAAAQLSHMLGVSLVGARILYAVGVAREPEPEWFRVIGFTVTLAVIATASFDRLFLTTAGAMSRD